MGVTAGLILIFHPPGTPDSNSIFFSVFKWTLSYNALLYYTFPAFKRDLKKTYSIFFSPNSWGNKFFRETLRLFVNQEKEWDLKEKNHGTNLTISSIFFHFSSNVQLATNSKFFSSFSFPHLLWRKCVGVCGFLRGRNPENSSTLDQHPRAHTPALGVEIWKKYSRITLFPGDSSLDGCTSVIPSLLELKVVFSVFSYFSVKCETFF